MHADTLQEGLQFLKSQGYDLMQQITQTALKNDDKGDKRQKIIDDFGKALTVQKESKPD